MWELDHKEGWVPKNRCFQTVVPQKTLESPLDSKEINPKGNQSLIFIRRTDAEASILGPPDVKRWLTGKDPDAGKDWGQEKRVTESEMVGWHHWLNRHESGQTPGGSEGQGSLACCSLWGHKELDTAEGLNKNNHYSMDTSVGRQTTDRMIHMPPWYKILGRGGWGGAYTCVVVFKIGLAAGHSLSAQWLGLPPQGARVPSLVGELKPSCLGQKQ